MYFGLGVGADMMLGLCSLEEEEGGCGLKC
jgi:hypothetical protein